MIRRLFLAAAATAFLSPAAMAEPIPLEQLKSDYDQCMVSCSATDSEAVCTNFCRCNNSGIQSQFNYEEYQSLVTAFSTDAVADQALMSRFMAIVDSCRAQLGQ
ncbi:MAG: hypothetical protein WD711_13625 [Dongiaceae bacterium]